MKNTFTKTLIIVFSFFCSYTILAQSSFQGLYLEEIDNTSGSFINGD